MCLIFGRRRRSDGEGPHDAARGVDAMAAAVGHASGDVVGSERRLGGHHRALPRGKNRAA